MSHTHHSYFELDISNFGSREREMICDLFKALRKDRTVRFLGPAKIGFNLNSGNVFLIDEDYNVAMEENGELHDFLSCPECGNEGLSTEFDTDEPCCAEFFENYEKDREKSA